MTIVNWGNSWHIAKHMQKIILGVLVAVMLIPAFSQAATPTTTESIAVQEMTLEEQKIELLKQIISLLQLRIQQLIAIRDGLPIPTVLGISTSNPLLTSSTTPEVEIKKRRGGGGGGSSSNRAAIQAKETACRLAGDLAIAPGDTKLAYYAINGEPVYAGWAPDTTKELYNYLYAYLDNYIDTGNEFFTHIPDYRLYYALQHAEVLETRFSDYLENKTLCGEEALDETDILVPLSSEILTLTAEEPTLDEEDEEPSTPNITCELTSTDIDSGATFTFCTPTNPIVTGEDFDLLVGIDSGTTSINAVTATLNFNTDYLSVTSVSKIGSDFSLWTTEPEYSNEFGTVEIGAGVAEPISGTSTLLAIHFSPLIVGTTTIDVSAEILAADGLATDIYTKTNYPVYTIENASIEEPYDATLEFNTSSDNPDATILVVDEDDKTDYTILVFELEAQEGPITIGDAYIRVETPDGVASSTIDDSELIINGVVHDQDGIQAIEGDASAQLHMFRLDTVVATNTPLEIEFSVEFEGYAGVYDVPQEVFASIDLDTRSLWEAEGYDDLNPATDFLGTVLGETHTLFGAGLYLDDVDIHTELTTFDTSGSIGRFEIEFEATAIEDDFYFTDFATTSDTTNGLKFYIDGADTISALSTVVTSSADEESNGVYLIQEGNTEVITLQVEIEASETGNFRIGLEDLFATRNFDGVTDTKSTVILDPYSFRTNYLVIIAE